MKTKSEPRMKSLFLDKVYQQSFPEAELEKYIPEYLYINERFQGPSFWQQFANAKEVLSDFERFVEYAREVDFPGEQ